MDGQLKRIRQKVEQGEPLTPAELDRLRAAAQGDAGPHLKLALAHALSNAEEDREAMQLLSRLIRDFPKERSVRLGYARALVGLERYTEAAEVLKAVLAENPSDPEVLKSLALLALRHGELARAEKHTHDALARDPLDAEARLIRDELSHRALPAPALGVRRALRPEFISALLAALRAREVRCLQRGTELWLKTGSGGAARVDLSTLFAAYLDEGEPLDRTVEAMAEELSCAVDVPSSSEPLLARVRPVLRPPSFAQAASGSAHREGIAGLLVFYVVDDRELVRYVPEGMLATLGVTLEELDAAAWQNLEELPGTPRAVIVEGGEPRLSPEPLGLFAVCQGDGYDAARLLCPSQAKLLELALGGGPYRVGLGRRELVLVCREEDRAGLSMLEALKEAPDGIPGRFLFRGGRLSAL